jgi:purine-nucleoside/S-methyl-5'-thioadenosine phosphorylase / adenosine deaminase
MSLLHQQPGLKIYFGNAHSGITSSEHHDLQAPWIAMSISSYTHIKTHYQLDHLVFLRQTHSCDGELLLHKDQCIKSVPFTQEGDFLITPVARIGLGVLTADCIPLIMYVPSIPVISIVHAGWRGVFGGIVPKVLQALMIQWNITADAIQAFVGPCAKSCCYYVKPEFLAQIAPAYIATIDQLVTHDIRGMKFNLVRYVQLQLEAHGVVPQNIELTYTACTICNPEFYSYRRQSLSAGRQMTVAFITEE